MKIKTIRMSNGEPYLVLLGNDGKPAQYPNLFVTTFHFIGGDSHNTCSSIFERIRYLYEVFTYLDINIEERCIKGEFLTENECDELCYWAKIKVTGLRKAILQKKQPKQKSNTRVQSIETARASIVIENENECAVGTAYNRLTLFAEYINWLEEKLFSSKAGVSHEQLIKHRDKLGTTQTDEGEFYSLERWQVLRILDVIRPDSPNNPWANDVHLRHRNQLIINLFEATGCRRGELARLKIDDFISRNGLRFINITAHADNEDSRLKRPEGKTLGRKFPLDSRIGEMFDNYVIYHRSEVQGAQFLSQVFITHHLKQRNNFALSLSSINKLFRVLSEAVGFSVHPHAFRHTWNDRFSAMADARILQGKTTAEKSEKDRQKLMGWTDKSKMAQYYSKRHAIKRAMEVGLQLQELNNWEMNYGVPSPVDEQFL